MIRRRIVWPLGAVVFGAVLVLAGAPQERPAAAATPHRAAVVVDLGDGRVRVGCATFTEDSISGLEALQRASMQPVSQSFGSKGGAVCALCGKGCAAGSSCLTCQAPKYWAYFHKGAYSRVGASSTRVRDGDTEGWKWGTGEAPTGVSFQQVCPNAAPPPTPAPTTQAATTTSPPVRSVTPPPNGGSGGSGGGGLLPGGGGGSPGTVSSTVPGSADPTSTAPTIPRSTTPGATGPSASTSPSKSGSTTTSAPQTSKEETKKQKAAKPSTSKPSSEDEESASAQPRGVVVERAGKQSGSAAGSDEDSGSSLLSIGGFVVAIGVVGGLALFVRRRRHGLTA